MSRTGILGTYMSQLSSNIPVIVGVGQVTHRTDDVAEATTPLDLMEQALRAAAEDADCPRALSEAQLIAVVAGLWSYSDPGAALAESLGCPGAETWLSHFGGNVVQDLVSAAAQSITTGDLDLALLVGAEARKSAALIGKAGGKLDTTQSGMPEATRFGPEFARSDQVEIDRGVLLPINAYPLFESALRAARGESIAENRTACAELYAGFSAVAAQNPYAWRREPMTAAEIREASPTNRFIGFPYTRAMCADPKVDMGAAVIICSEAKAAELGIEPERWVYPQSSASGADTELVGERESLSTSEPMRLVGERALALAEASIDDVAYVDLYACFPSAVRMAADAFGLSLDRPLTQTGGLHFGGGPMNNGVMHAIAQTVSAVRDDPGSLGMVHANGGFVTKQLVGLYRSTPPTAGFRHESVQAQLDARPVVPYAAADAVGDGVIEAVTVQHGRDGAERAIAGVRLDSGERAWVNSSEATVMELLQTEESVGRSARVEAGVLRV